ncbi:MAG: hypothetical protein R2713_18115 [Ilumatobacteraceae bacterium]
MVFRDQAGHRHRCIRPQELLDGERHHLGSSSSRWWSSGCWARCCQRRPMVTAPRGVDAGDQSKMIMLPTSVVHLDASISTPIR